MARKAKALPDIHRNRNALKRREAILSKNTTNKMAGISMAPNKKKFKYLSIGVGTKKNFEGGWKTKF